MLVSSMEASLPGPLSGSLRAPLSAGHRFQGHSYPFSEPWGCWHTFCRAPAQPRVGATPSEPLPPPDGPLCLGTCSNSRPQPPTQMEPGPAPSPGPHRDHMQGMQRAWLW